MANAAHVYKAKSGNYNMSFHHPIVREGTIGKKIHRGLKVADDLEAERLRKQIDELLQIAADTPSLLLPRSSAEQKYARVIVDAFYDCMTPEPIDYKALRDRMMPLPPRAWVPHVLIAGGTGVGKSRLAQHLLQTTSRNFPMRGAGRTTVSDTEVVIGDVDYSAVMTFFAENEIRQTLKENIIEACSFAQGETDRARIASKLLVDADKRFRFNFVLGNWAESGNAAEDEDDDLDESNDEMSLPAAPDIARWSNLGVSVERIIGITETALRDAEKQLPEKNELDADDWLPFIDQEQVDALAEEILGELEIRLCAATGASSWPVSYQIPATNDRDEFFVRLQRFYQNSRKLFGILVTPLVQGIRVRGRFFPPEWAGKSLRNWVLLDGQGVGHEQGEPTGMDRTIPPELAQKFSSADLICLVDRSAPSMTGDAPTLLEHLLTRGYLERLLLCFTFFESVEAPDLDGKGRKTKVMEGLSNAIQKIVLPKAQRVLLEKNALSQSYFLSSLNLEDVAVKSTRAAIKLICDRIQTGTSKPAKVENVRPMYNEYEIANLVSNSIIAYRRDWSESSLASRNYKIIEALTNWIGNTLGDGYPRRRLYPGQNLSERLVSAISIHLEQPREWAPITPNEVEQSKILNAIRTSAADRIDRYCRQVVIQDPRTSRWRPAYKDISGTGTLRKRAKVVSRILEDQAELPEEGLGQFAKDIWQQVEEAIVEVCCKKEQVSDVA